MTERGEELNRLTDAGVPLGPIAAALGMTVEEMRKAASSGKLTADQFFEATAAVEMFQGAAKAAGDTTRGAWSNTLTALKKLGADFLGPLFGENGHAVQGLKALQERIKSLSPAVKAAGVAFANWLVPAVREVVGSFYAFANAWKYADGDITSSGLPGHAERLGYALRRVYDTGRNVTGWLRTHQDQIGRVARAVLPAVGAVAAFAVGINRVTAALKLMAVAGPIGLLVALASGLIYAYQHSERFRTVVNGAFRAVGNVVGPIVERLSGLLSGLFGSGDGIGDRISAPFARLTTVWGDVRKTASRVWPDVQRRLAAFGGYLGRTLQPLVRAFGNYVTSAFDLIGRAIVKGIELWGRYGDQIIAFVTPIAQYLQRAFERVVSILTSALNAWAAVFQGDWSQVWTHVKEIASTIWAELVDRFQLIVTGLRNAWPHIRTFISNIPGWIGDALAALAPKVRELAETGFGKLTEAAGSVWDNHLKPWIIALPGNIIDAGRSLAPRLLAFARTAFRELWSAAGWAWNSLLKPRLQALPGDAVDALRSLAPRIGAAASSAFRELWSGLGWVWDNLLRPRLAALPGDIVRGMGNVGSTLLNTGKALAGGLVTGIGNGLSGLGTTMWNTFKSAVNRLIRAWNNLQFTIGGQSWEIPTSPWTVQTVRIPSLTISTPNIPVLHSGGRVPGRHGQEVLTLLQAGEEVLTRPQQRGAVAAMAAANPDGGNNVHVTHYWPAGVDARSVMNAQRRYARRNGRPS